MPYLSRFLRGIAPIACGALLSCGGGDDEALVRGGASGSAGTGAGTDGGLGIVVGGSDASLGLTVDGEPTGLVGGGSLDDAACAKETRQGEQIPLDMYIMLDRSPSMMEFISDKMTTKWDAIRNAINSFLNDPASKGLGVGLQFFPLTQPNVPAECFAQPDCGKFGPCAGPLLTVCENTMSFISCDTNANCPRGSRCGSLGACGTGLCNFVGQLCAPENGGQPQPCREIGACVARDICDQAAYVAPAVEVAPLPGAAAAIATSLMQHTPDDLPVSGTPTVIALNGALSHAKTLAAANTKHRVVVVLATDGLPTAECPAAIQPNMSLIQNLQTLAAGSFKATPSLPTFVIGVFAPTEATEGKANLDAVAKDGGTGTAFIVNTSQNVTMSFLAALDSIRTTSLTCDYNVPQPTSGQLDYSAVNVIFTSGAGQQLKVLYAGPTAASCTDKGGWYYDVDPTAGGTPTKIGICPVSCNTLKADTAGKVNILLGCKTESVVR
jgi:hypothetical protein